MAGARAPLIPSYGLDLSHVPMAERGDAWRDAFGGQWETPDLPTDFEPGGRAFDFGKAVLADTTHPDLKFVRHQAMARRDGVDNIYILTQVTGAYHMETDDREDQAGVGEVTTFDIARPVSRFTSGGRTLCLAVGRELIEAALPGVDVHALKLRSGGALMAEHLVTLRKHLPSTERAAARHLLQGTVMMLAACVLPTAERVEKARPLLSGALLTRAKRYIRANCTRPDLAPDTIARAVGASRTSLYRAFEPEGGVAGYVRKARLDAAREALLDPGERRRIGEIAYDYGFGSEAQFSRAVRAAFGVTPTALRQGQGGLYVPLSRDKWILKGWGAAKPLASDEESGQVIKWPGPSASSGPGRRIAG